MSEIRNQLQTLTGAEIKASELSQVGGKVFTNAQDSQGDFKNLVSWWMAIHAPTYGQPIPGSAFKTTHTGDGAVYAPGVNESAKISALTITNGDGTNPATVTIDVDGVLVHQEVVPALGWSNVIGFNTGALELTNGQTLGVTITVATPALVSLDFSGFLTVQG